MMCLVKELPKLIIILWSYRQLHSITSVPTHQWPGHLCRHIVSLTSIVLIKKMHWYTTVRYARVVKGMGGILHNMLYRVAAARQPIRDEDAVNIFQRFRDCSNAMIACKALILQVKLWEPIADLLWNIDCFLHFSLPPYFVFKNIKRSLKGHDVWIIMRNYGIFLFYLTVWITRLC